MYFKIIEAVKNRYEGYKGYCSFGATSFKKVTFFNYCTTKEEIIYNKLSGNCKSTPDIYFGVNLLIKSNYDVNIEIILWSFNQEYLHTIYFPEHLFIIHKLKHIEYIPELNNFLDNIDGIMIFLRDFKIDIKEIIEILKTEFVSCNSKINEICKIDKYYLNTEQNLNKYNIYNTIKNIEACNSEGYINYTKEFFKIINSKFQIFLKNNGFNDFEISTYF